MSSNKKSKLVIKRFQETLPCRLTDAELQVRGEVMAQADQDIATLEDQKSSAVAEFKAKIEQASGRRSQAAATIRSKQEHRLVDCELRLDYKKGKATKVRTDTGEKLEVRDLRPDEQQMPLIKILPTPPPAAKSPESEKPADTAPEHVEPAEDDDKELIERAVEVLKSTRRASTATLKRSLIIGYQRSVKLMDKLEAMGIVGPAKGSAPREIVIDLDDEAALAVCLKSIKPEKS